MQLSNVVQSHTDNTCMGLRPKASQYRLLQAPLQVYLKTKWWVIDYVYSVYWYLSLNATIGYIIIGKNKDSTAIPVSVYLFIKLKLI